MDYHQHARLTVFSREALARQVIERGFTLTLPAASFNVSAKPAAKWVRRYRERGAAGLRDSSSRPHRLRQPTAAELVDRVQALRRERWTGLRIAQQTGLSRATVPAFRPGRWLRRRCASGRRWPHARTPIRPLRPSTASP